VKQPLNSIVEQAEKLYASRDDIRAVHDCVSLLDPSSATSYDAAWRLGRALFFLGQQAEKRDAEGFHKRGVTICKRAVQLGPTRVECHFWLGVNLALLASNESWHRALPHALAARRSLMKAVEIDSSYHGAGPLRVLGRVEQRLPRIFGGGTTHAVERFERAIRLAPYNTVTRIYFAELQLERGDADAARRHLEAVVNAPYDPLWEFEINRDKKIADEMLRAITSRQALEDRVGTM
jgi:tetratricopeptide (TPR) repeat protein